MNEQQRAVVQQALDAFWVCAEHNALHFGQKHNTVVQANSAANALRQLQAASAGGVVLMNDITTLIQENQRLHARVDELTKAYKAVLEQPEPVPLTDEQADLLINGRGEHGDDDYVEPTGDGFGLTDEDLVKLIRRVEAHHGIGVKP
jgi:hypothetical protein